MTKGKILFYGSIRFDFILLNKFIYFIYLFLAALGLHCGTQTSHCGGFSCCGAQALECRLSSCGAQV